MWEGNLFGHVISKDVIKIDPHSLETIQKVDMLGSKKEIRSFHGRINFLRRFIPNFAYIMKYITNILRKGNEMKWNTNAKQSFDGIKRQ